MDECMVASKTLGMMIILISIKVGIQKLTKLTVKRWGDNGETISEMNYKMETHSSKYQLVSVKQLHVQ